MGLWTPSPNLPLLQQKIDFRLQTSLICQNEKKQKQKQKKATSCEKCLLGLVLQKNVPKNYTKFTEKYLARFSF